MSQDEKKREEAKKVVGKDSSEKKREDLNRLVRLVNEGEGGISSIKKITLGILGHGLAEMPQRSAWLGAHHSEPTSGRNSGWA